MNAKKEQQKDDVIDLEEEKEILHKSDTIKKSNNLTNCTLKDTMQNSTNSTLKERTVKWTL